MRSIRAAGWIALALTVGCGGASPFAEVEAPEAAGLGAAPAQVDGPKASASAEPAPAPPKPAEPLAVTPAPAPPKPAEPLAVAPAPAPPKPAEPLAVAPAPAPPKPTAAVAVEPAPVAPAAAPVDAVAPEDDAAISDDDDASDDEAVAANAEGSSGGAGSDDDEEASEDEAVAAEDAAAEDGDEEPPPVARDDESLVLLESDGVMRVKQRWARLRESAYERLHAIAEKYHEATGRRLVVTGGGRKPARQAELMYGMMKDGKDLLRLYIQVTLVRPLIGAFEKGKDERWGRRRTVAEMTKIIDDQVQGGRYVSRHLAHTAADVRSRGLSDEDVEALKAAVDAVKGSHLVDERNGNAPHFHLRL